MKHVWIVDDNEEMTRAVKLMWKNLPVITLSTETPGVTVERAMELGTDSYVSKPLR